MDLSHLMLHTATRWSNPTPDGYGGESYDPPATLACRWENRAEMFTTPSGEEVRSMAIVYTYTEIVEGDRLAFGDFTSATTTTTTTTEEGAVFTPDASSFKVQRVDSSDPLDGIGDRLYKAYL